MHRRLFSTLIILIALLITSCGGQSTPTKGDAIVFVAVPLSGFQANGGQTILGGVRLAAAEINQTGGLLGYRVVVRSLDDESDSDVAINQANQVKNAIDAGEQVLGVIGHLNSGQTLATMELYKDLPVVVITPTASEKSLTERGYTNFFRVNANDNIQAAVDAEFFVSKLKAKRVIVLYNDTPYGKGLAATLVQELKQRGAETVLNIQVAEAQNRFPDEVAKIKSTPADAIFYAGYEIEAAYLRADIVEAGITLPMLASDGAFLASTIDESNGTAEGMYFSAFAPSPEQAANAQWIEAYQAVEYRNPDTYSINGYIAMQVLAEGVRKADTLTTAQVADAIRNNAIDTILKPLRFEADGDVVDAQIWIYQVVDGEFKQVQ